MNNEYGLTAINPNTRGDMFYVHKGDPQDKKWVAIVIFKGSGYTVYPFRSDTDLSEKIAICSACGEKLHELASQTD
jgi:hypothetical protein